MQGTAVVEVVRHAAHPLYKKLKKISKNYKVSLNGQTVSDGQTVRIIETKQVAKGKYFAIQKVLSETHEKKAKIASKKIPSVAKTGRKKIKKEAKK